MHLIDNIRLKFKVGIIWSDSAYASSVDVPGKPGTSTAKLYSAGSLHMRSFITKRVKPITPIVFSTFQQPHRLKQTSFPIIMPL